MADDVDLAAPSGTAAADDIGGKLYQKVKGGWGGDGTWNETDTATGKPFPIQLRGSDGTDRSNLLPVTVSSITAGDNNIGNVDLASAIPAGTNNIGDVDVASIAAGDNNIGNVDIVSLPVAFNSGAASATTQRVVIASDQLGSLGGAARTASVPVAPAHLEYETVAVSQTNQMLGATGNVADYIEGLICVVATATSSQVQLKDGNGTAFTVLPNNVGGGIGTYYIPLMLKCVNATTPGWQVTTAAGVTVIAIGDFT